MDESEARRLLYCPGLLNSAGLLPNRAFIRYRCVSGDWVSMAVVAPGRGFVSLEVRILRFCQVVAVWVCTIVALGSGNVDASTGGPVGVPEPSLAVEVADDQDGAAGVGVDAAIAANRRWDVLRPPSGDAGARVTLQHAADLLGDCEIELASVPVTSALLRKLASSSMSENMVRAAREVLRRPVDLDDFLFFLDDVLLARTWGQPATPIVVTAGRARAAGIMLHPQDVFEPTAPHVYGETVTRVNLDRPAVPTSIEPAADGAPLGPGWAGRYPNPDSDEAKLRALRRVRPTFDFAERVAFLLEQLRSQGADVYLDSTVRSRQRGYLMWGAFALSRANSADDVERWVQELPQVAVKWGLNIPIVWMHPQGWRATVEAARQMAEAYSVVYATRRGARYSDHYDGVAVDFTAVGLPRQLRLQAPDGARAIFDLSDPHSSRDLNLTEVLVVWLETHFHFEKLRFDYPHWTDARATDSASSLPVGRRRG